jgi:hypothetical protein
LAEESSGRRHPSHLFALLLGKLVVWNRDRDRDLDLDRVVCCSAIYAVAGIFAVEIGVGIGGEGEVVAGMPSLCGLYTDVDGGEATRTFSKVWGA